MVAKYQKMTNSEDNINFTSFLWFFLVCSGLVVFAMLIYYWCCKKKKKHTPPSQPQVSRQLLQRDRIEQVDDQYLTLARRILEDTCHSTSTVDRGSNITTETSPVSNPSASSPLSNFTYRTAVRGTPAPSVLLQRIPMPSQSGNDAESPTSQRIQMQHYERISVDVHPQLARLLPWDTSRLPPTRITAVDENIANSTTRIPLDPSAAPPAYHEFEIASNPVEGPSAPSVDSPTVLQESERTFSTHSINSLTASSTSLPTYDEIEGRANLAHVPQHAQEEHLPPSYEDFIARPHAYGHIPENTSD